MSMYFEPTDEQERAVALALTGNDLAIKALAGCLAGDTLIQINRGGKGYLDRIDNIASQMHGHGSLKRGGRQWNPDIPTMVTRAVGDVFRLGQLADAWFSGEKQTYTLRTERGATIRATSEHPFMLARGGWVQLGELRPGHQLAVNSGRSANGRGPKRLYRYTTTCHHPNQAHNTQNTWKVPTHRLVVEAAMNGMPLESFIEVLRRDREQAAGLTYLDRTVHVHHRDGDPLNNRWENLQVLTELEHHQLHARKGDEQNVLWWVGVDRVESISPFGLEPTYDIEVFGAPHNFLANGFVVHNTGKTSTLRLIAEAKPDETGQYIAFNKSIVTDAQGTFPRNVACSTAHSLAFQAVGKFYAHRLKGGRMKPQDLARALGLNPLRISVDGKDRTLAAGFLAGVAKRAVQQFCQTADRQIGRQHVPYLDGIDAAHSDGRRSFYNNDKVRDWVEPVLARFWADVERKDGTLPFDHGCYLKLWQLSDPTINADFILYDEAQDANPCMLSIVAQQKGKAQLIYVGDDYQQIYAWNGAVNALDSVGGEVAYLTQSFRFGDEIARAANHALGMLGATIEVTGTATIESRVDAIVMPSVILCRTNAVAVREALNALAENRRVALVGGADEIIRFAEAAESLRLKGWTSHPELACFDNWNDVKDYVDQDPSGSDLKLLVKLIDDFGTAAIIEGLGRCGKEADADLVISTAHKSKGREWPEVTLAGDFPDPDKREPSDEELRLLYVAMTRAKLLLDIRAVKLMKNFQNAPVAVEAPLGPLPTSLRAPLGIQGEAGQETEGGAELAVADAPPSKPPHPRGGEPQAVWDAYWAAYTAWRKSTQAREEIQA